MPRERKWVYWHRIKEVPEGCPDVKIGELLGLNHKTKDYVGLKFDNERRTYVLADMVKVEFLGRMLRTATADEIVAAFGGSS